MITTFKDVNMYRSIEEDGSVAFDIYRPNKSGEYFRIAPDGVGFLNGIVGDIKIIGVDFDAVLF